MSNYPNQLDDDVSLPRVDNNITEEGGDAINAQREAIFNIEEALGLGAPGGLFQYVPLTQFLLQPQPAFGNVPFFLPDGTINPSFFISLPQLDNIVNSQISPVAGIQESKLALDYPTASLYSIIQNVNNGVDTSLNFITNHGSKIEPHIAGAAFRHIMNHIDVDSNVNNYFKNRYGLLRNNTNLYTLLNDINLDLVAHEKADSTDFGSTSPTSTIVGTIPPNNYAHVSSGIYLNTSNFSFVPQTATDLQQFAQFIDNSNIFILGTRIQTLYQNGVSRTSRSPIPTDNTHGQLIVPPTTVTAYHLYSGSAPFDDINNGDDVVEFFPTDGSAAHGYVFDNQFASVKIGDILTINYGTVVASFIIKEIKYVSGTTFAVRINGKNLIATTAGIAQINRPLFNTEKYGVLALAQAQPSIPINNSLASLIVGSPRGAEVLGNGFSADDLDSTHYNLYLVIYPDGNPFHGSLALAPIDVTGNQGATPGKYTLESIVNATNAVFRSPGYNYRFIAYSNGGNFGIMLADSYGEVSFSIISGALATNGSYDSALTSTIYPNNVVNVFDEKDALGFGFNGANVASPPFATSYINVFIAQVPTKIFVPLTRKTFYVNGVERERLNIEPNQDLDTNGDGYWPATIINKQIIGSRVRVIYQVNRDLSTSGLKIGKTIVVQSEGGSGGQVDFGRFFIEDVEFDSCACDGYSAFSKITVYDAVHGTGVSPFATSGINTKVRLYFSSDSVGFNTENIFDSSTLADYKRHFEIYVNEDGYTFSHERGRMDIGGTTGLNLTNNLYTNANLVNLNIYKISPKLRGYIFSNQNKINLQIFSYNQSTGVFDGYLCAWDGSTVSNPGPLTTGKKGQIVRFYDETNVDHIDFIFSVDDTVSTFSNANIDIQLFPTLSLDDEIMQLGTCQVNDLNKQVSYLRDIRQFGNVSEKQLSDSAITFIQAGDRHLHQNGVVRGFDLEIVSNNNITLTGGIALVNGELVAMNHAAIVIPIARELFSSTQYNINWVLCVNEQSEFVVIPLTDYDPILGTPNSPNRLFTLINSINLLSYPIDSTTFNDLINRKDLTPLYLVASTVSGTLLSATASLSVQDMRKFAADATSIITPTLTDQSTQGNFRSINAACTWSRFNRVYQNSLDVKSSYTSTTDPVFSNLNVSGKGVGASISVTSNVSMTSAKFDSVNLSFGGTYTGALCKFNGLTLNVSGQLISNSSSFDGVILTAGNIFTANSSVFNNTSISLTSFLTTINGSTFNNTVGATTFASTANITSSTFNGGSFTFSSGNTLTAVTFNNCNILFSAGGTFSNVTFNNCTIHFAAGTFSLSNVLAQGCTITQDVSFPAGNAVTILDTQLTLTSTNCAVLGSNYRLERNIFNWNASSPLGDGYYSSTDLINISNGMFTASLGASTHLDNLIVKDCTFNTSLTDRYSFFSFKLNDISAYVKDVVINNNKFNSNANANDIRAVIAFTSTLAINGSSQANTNVVKNPTLFNVTITNNSCNYDQMIVLAANRLNLGAGFNTVTGPLLSTINCKISNNSCGTIGFITASTDPYNGSNSDISGLSRNKTDRLIISDNVCKLITNLDYLGQYVEFRPTFPDGGVGSVSHRDLVNTATGPCLITNNSVNWIQVGASAQGSFSNGTSATAMQTYEGMTITDNSLCPANPNYLNNFTDTVNTFSMGNYGIMLRREFNGTGNTRSIISGNKLSQKPSQNSNGTVTSFYYDDAIVCLNSAVITNNVVNAVVNNPNGSILVLWSTGNSIVSNNIFERGLVPDQTGLTAPNNTNTIQSYIWCAAGANASNLVRITDNIFDSQWVDQANTIEMPGLTIPPNWAFFNNKNQVAYASFDPNQLDWFSDGGGTAQTTAYFNGKAAGGGVANGWVADLYTTTNFNYITHTSFDSIIPIGARLLYVAMGFRQQGSGLTTGNSNIIVSKPNAFTAVQPFTGTLADLSVSGMEAFNYPSNSILGLTGASTYAHHDLSGVSVISGAGYTIQYQISLNVIVTSGFVEFLIAPILLKFIY